MTEWTVEVVPDATIGEWLRHTATVGRVAVVIAEFGPDRCHIDSQYHTNVGGIDASLGDMAGALLVTMARQEVLAERDRQVRVRSGR